MAELIRSLKWDHARKTLHILAHIVLFAWIVSLVMHTKDTSNSQLVFQYFGIAIYTVTLMRINNSILEE